MKFVKENLTLVVCGVIVLLAIVSAFYPTGSMRADWVKARQEEYQGSHKDIETITNMKLEVPAVATTLKGEPTENVYNAKVEAIKRIQDEAKAVIELGAQANRQNRITLKGVPLLNGQPQVNYLPKTLNGVDPNEFAKAYNALFTTFLTKLAGANAGPTVPPDAAQVIAAFQAKQTAAAERDARVGLQGIGMGQTNVKEQNDQLRREAQYRAAHIHMYVDMADAGGGGGAIAGQQSLGAFQRRPWLDTGNPPDEGQIFEALVDSWFQSDVVNAIASVNDAVLNKISDSSKRNVGSAPIKRLMHIAVGSDALVPRLTLLNGATAAGNPMGGVPAGSTSTLFYNPVSQAAAPTGDAPIQAAGTSAPNTIDLTRTLTGRSSGADYDVVMMQIWMDIDPAYVNRFCDALYKQNMGYTVLNIREKTVDPLDRASWGYVYGEGQTVEVEITVEGLLFRNWTGPLMPPRIQASLGIVPAAAAQPGQ